MIWTNAETTCPCEFVIVHEGPGAIQPCGVDDDAVSQLAALLGPRGDDVPGLKMLPFSDAPPRALV